MKKLLTLLGVFSILLVLAGCTTTSTVKYTEPSFVGLSIDGQNPNTGSDLVTFYKEKNELTLVKIELNNPDQLEIRSISIKGYSYGNSRFTEDSTTNTIYFYLNAGTILGLEEYTVTDLEYFDGADSKDVVISSSNNRFNLYVYKDIPLVAREGYELGQDNIQIDFNIADTDGVIDTESLVIELFDGDSLISSEVVNPGFVSITFDNLSANKLYEIKVRADYDLDNSVGSQEEVVLFNGTFTTLPTSLPSSSISNVEIESDKVTFDVTYKDEDNVTALGGLRVQLFRGSTFEREILLDGTQSDIVFDNLFNSTEYSVKVISDYNLRDGKGTKTDYILSGNTFTTLSRSVPVPQIDNVTVETNRILFDIVIEDDLVTPIIDLSTLVAKVYVEGVLSRTVDISSDKVDIQIYDVLSGKNVYIELVASYDLNDGNGVQTNQVIHVIEYESLLNSKPVAYIDDITVTQGYVIVDGIITDVDNTLKGSISAVLFEDGIEVASLSVNTETTEIVFPYLVEFTRNYRVEIMANYNLRDGAGTKTDQVLYAQALTSLVPKAPASELQNIVVNNEGFNFNILVMDSDSTVVGSTLYVYIYDKDGFVVGSQALVVGLNSVSYNGLLSNNEYQVVVSADFNVLDGSGLQTDQTLVFGAITTLAKEVPTAVITDPDQTISSVKANIEITDEDGVIEAGTLSAVLTKDGVVVGSPVALVVGDNFNVEFTGIMSDSNYVINIYVDYDLDDSKGIIEDVRLGDIQIRTDIKELPEGTIQNVTSGIESISFDVIITDPDNVITAGTTKAVLYIGDTPTVYEILLNVGLNTGVTFNNIYSDQDFNIRILTDYDLDDGVTSVVGEMLTYDFADTGINQMVTGSIYSVTEGIDSITFSAAVTDPDSVVTGNLKALLLLNNIPTGDEIAVVVGDNINLQFTGLISDSEYTIRLVTDYSKRDLTGEITDQYLDSYTTNTDDYSAPSGYLNNITTTIDSISFTAVISDADGTSTGQFKAVLFENGVATGHIQNLNNGYNDNIVFGSLLSNVEYEIRLLATYDLHDGLGDQVDEVIYSTLVDTLARKSPVGNAASISISDSTVHFVFTYVDEDLTMITTSLKAWLYDRDDVLVSSKSLYADEVTFDISFMLADYAFKVCVTGDYDLSDGDGLVEDRTILCVDLRTSANAEPSVIVSNPVINQDNVAVTVDVQDDDLVIEGNLKAQLFDSSHVLVAEVPLVLGVNQIQFPAVLNAKELYNIMVVTDYDLRDGEGIILEALLSENSIMAFNKVIPQARITNVTQTVNSLSFDVLVLDNFTTYVGNAKAVLYLDGVYVDEAALVIGSNTNVTFTGLVSNAEYEVRIFIDYNNGDGNNDVLGYKMTTELIDILAKDIPSATTANETVDSDSISIDITVTDTDSVISANLKAVLYKNGLPIAEQPLVVGANVGIAFTSLKSDSSYDIKVEVDYDLDDNVTVVTGAILLSRTTTTVANSAPTATFTASTTTTSTYTFSVTITDTDSVITGNTKAVIYKDGIAVAEQALVVGVNTLKVFTGLYSDSQYTINVQTDYDLNNGGAASLGVVMSNNTKTTVANRIPTALVGNTIVGDDEITFDVIVTDPDSVISGNLIAALYLNGIPTGDTIALTVGSNLAKVFSPIFSNKLYEVKVLTDYDLLNGDGGETAYELGAVQETTLSKATPNAIISNQSVTNSTISMDVTLEDVSSAIQGSATAVLYLNGTATGQTVTLAVGANAGVTFVGLDYGVTYDIQIETDYNNNIGNADVVDYVLTQDTQTTQALVQLENIVTTVDEVYFDILLNDQFGILDDDYLYLKLYDEGGLLAGSYVIQGTGTVDILHYYNDHTYHLVVEANVTATGTQDIVYETDIVVPPRAVQAISIGKITVNATEISTSVAVVLPDPEGVINAPSIEAVLYRLDAGVWVQIDQTTLIDGTNTITFTGLTPQNGTTAYMIRVEATVDFNDGAGAVADYIIDARTFIYTTQN